MKITLRKAHALQQEIKTLIQAYHSNLTNRVDLDDFSPVQTQIDHAQSAVSESLVAVRKLTDVLYAIRKAVAHRNVTSTISEKLADMELLDKHIRALDAVYSNKGIGQVRTVEQLERMLEKIRSDTTGRAYFNAPVAALFTKEQMSEGAAEIAKLRKSKAQLADELLEANIANTITLTPDQVQVLTDHGLV